MAVDLGIVRGLTNRIVVPNKRTTGQNRHRHQRQDPLGPRTLAEISRGTLFPGTVRRSRLRPRFFVFVHIVDFHQFCHLIFLPETFLPVARPRPKRAPARAWLHYLDTKPEYGIHSRWPLLPAPAQLQVCRRHPRRSGPAPLSVVPPPDQSTAQPRRPGHSKYLRPAKPTGPRIQNSCACFPAASCGCADSLVPGPSPT